MGILENFRANLANLIAPSQKSLLAAEGGWRGQFAGIGELGGSYGLGRLEDGWQRNLRVDGSTARHVPALYACVMTISRAVSQCYPKHVRQVDGKFEEVLNSSAYRVLNNPNSYSTGPQFLLNLMASTLFDGEAFVLATRNNRQEIDSLHLLPRGSCSPLVDPDTREVFYSVGTSPLAPGGSDFIAPARDILHMRYHTPRHPLCGESAVKAAAMAIGINVALSHSQAAFFSQMSRPSGILATDQTLNRDQIMQLRAAFEDQAAGMSQGKIPVLANGLKFSPLSVNSQDAQLVEAQRMSIADIARCYGVPLPLIGELEHATLNNSETLIGHFLAISLGSYLEGLERAFDKLFGFTGNEYVEFDIAALLRTDYAGRIDALTKGVSGGLYTPNEARHREGLNPIDGGDEVFMQRQNTPVSLLTELAAQEAAKQEPAPIPTPVDPTPDITLDDGVDTANVKSIMDARIFRARRQHG